MSFGLKATEGWQFNLHFGEILQDIWKLMLSDIFVKITKIPTFGVVTWITSFYKCWHTFSSILLNKTIQTIGAKS